jgi:hypothetical protein
MGKKLFDILKGSATMGLFAGLYALTGHDLDPQSVVVGLCDVLVSALGGHLGSDALQLWGDIKFALLVYSILTLIVFLLSVAYCGARGAAAAACGYFGMMALVTVLRYGFDALYPAAILLAGGVIIATYIPDRGKVRFGKSGRRS